MMMMLINKADNKVIKFIEIKKIYYKLSVLLATFCLVMNIFTVDKV